MKGMQKISRGCAFRKAVQYAFANARGKFLCASELMMSRDAKGLTREFRLAKALRPGVAKPVWHQSLRLPAGELVAPAKFGVIAHDYMAIMGFDVANHQYLVVRHGLTHIHIVASRIGLDGKIWLGRQENLISTVVIQKLEIKYGLRQTKGPDYECILDAVTGLTKQRIKRPATRRPHKNELERHKRLQKERGTCELLPRTAMLAILNKARKAGRRAGMAAFLQVAEASGVNVQFRLSKSHDHKLPSQQSKHGAVPAATVTGIAFEYVSASDVLRIRGSKLGTAYSGPALSLEFGDVHSDLPLLQARTSLFGLARRVPAIPQTTYSKPLINEPKDRDYGYYRSSYTPMAASPASATRRRRNRQRAQTLDRLHKLSGSAVAFHQLLRHDQVVCLLPGNELYGLATRSREPVARLRRVARQGQTGVEAAQPDTAIAIEPASSQRQLRRHRAHELHAKALAQRLQWVADSTKQSIRESDDTAYLQAASAFLAAENAAQRQPNDEAWREWDQSIGIDVLRQSPFAGSIEERLGRLSPAGLPGIDQIERSLAQSEQNRLPRTSYAADALNLWGKAQAKAPKTALQSAKAPTQVVRPRSSKPR